MLNIYIVYIATIAVDYCGSTLAEVALSIPIKSNLILISKN